MKRGLHVIKIPGGDMGVWRPKTYGNHRFHCSRGGGGGTPIPH